MNSLLQLESAETNFEGYLRRAMLRMLKDGTGVPGPYVDEDLRRCIKVAQKVSRKTAKEMIYNKIITIEKAEGDADFEKDFTRDEVKILKNLYKRVKVLS